MKMQTTCLTWKRLAALAAAGLFSITGLSAAETVWLDSLDLKSMHQGWAVPRLIVR